MEILLSSMSKPVTPDWLLITKDWVNVIFWCVNIVFLLTTAVIGIMTYRSAKKTLLQPIKTEIFKEQVKEFAAILNFFNAKDETELTKDLAIERLVFVNAVHMIDQYAELFFDFEIEFDKRPYNRESCPSSIVTMEGMREHFVYPEDDFEMNEVASTKEKDIDPRVRAALWSKKNCDILFLPKEHSETVKALEKIKSSPLLPKECVDLLEEYSDIIDYNIEELMKLLTELATEFPKKYRNYESLSNIPITWIWNRYNDRKQSFEEQAKKIIDYIRGYYEVDEILISSKKRR